MIGGAQHGRDGGGLSLGLLVAIGSSVVLLGVVLLALLFVRTLDRAGELLAIAGNSQEQLLLATRIDAAMAAMLARPNAAEADAVTRLIQRYRTSIADEQKLAGRGGDEDRDAAAFAALLASGGDVDEPARLRALTRRIVARERREVATVGADAFRLQQQARDLAVALVAALSLLLLGGGLLLYRAVMRPVQALRDGALRLAAGGDGHVAPQGPAELRLLATGFNDMADRVAAQQELLEAAVRQRTAELTERNARLAAIDRSRRLFFSKVSHELRTPVSVMRGEAEVALRLCDDPLEALGHVVANAGFLERRLDDLLALARSNEGRLSLARAPTALAELAREAAAMAAPFARSSEVKLVVSGRATALPVTGDHVWLRQALLAAIDNAVKFAGTAPVEVRALRCGGEAVLLIADRGPGVAEHELARIFDPYVQTEEGRARGGSGLGLSLARWVVEQHGGQMEARRRRGGGLAIVMRLPLS